MLIKKTLVLIITLYQLFVSPFLGKNCRFYPSCSKYGQQAIEKYGALKGFYLFLKRILRCHPLNNNGGYDPLP